MMHITSRHNSRTARLVGGVALTLLLTVTAIPAHAAVPISPPSRVDATVTALLESGAVTGVGAKPITATTGVAGTRSDSGVRLDRAKGLAIRSDVGDVVVTPVGAGRAVTPQTDLVVYAGGDASHDFALTKAGPNAPSNAAFAVAHDPTAPTSYRFRFTVAGVPAQLVLINGVVVVTDAHGTVSNFVQPAWATDANGAAVPTSYAVSGDVLSQTVHHVGAAYPVVADPAMACDWINCTVQFNRSETRSIASGSWGAAAVVGFACGRLRSTITGFVCAVGLSVIAYMANAALNVDRCLGVRAVRYPGFGLASTPYPVIYSGGNCR
jgi:hypothetical protein